MAHANPERRAKTRQKIIDAFWSIYATTPLKQIRVSAIAEAAGCNRSTFYRYFDSIDDLLEQAEDDVINEITAYVQNYGQNFRNSSSFELTGEVYDLYAERISILVGPEGASAFPARLSAALSPTVIDLIGLDPDDPAATLMSRTLVSSAITIITIWYRQGKPISAERLAKLLYTGVTQGLFALREV